MRKGVFQVEERFQGVDASTQEVEINLTWALPRGARVLVITEPTPGEPLSLGVCNLSMVLDPPHGEQAAPYLAFLRQFASGKAPTSVTVQTLRNGNETLSKAEIVLTGPGGIEKRAVTDGEGQYVFDDLKPGTYLLKGSRTGFPPTSPVTVTVSANRCAYASVLFEKVGLIRGRVRDADGSPIAGAAVMAFREDDRGFPHYAEKPSGPDGSYQIEKLPPGRYAVGIRASFSSEAIWARPPAFHPSGDRKNAAVIEVGANEVRDLVDIMAEAAYKPRKVDAIVVDESGRPIANAIVVIQRSDEKNAFVRSPATDSEGRTSVTFFQELPIHARASRLEFRPNGLLASENVIQPPGSSPVALRFVVKDQFKQK